MKKILVVIPIYINNEIHLEFTEKTLASIHDANHTNHVYKVCIIYNYVNSKFRSMVDGLHADFHIQNSQNSVSSAWNLGIAEGVKSEIDYILVCNNDIILHPDAIDNLVKFAETHPEFIMWTAAQYSSLRSIKTATYGDSFDDHPHFSCFMIKRDFPDILKAKDSPHEPFPGYFDENIKPAYLEDNDMHNRILRAGFKAGITASALFYHFGSRTIQADDELNEKNSITHKNNKIYYAEKWGFNPDGVGIGNDDPVRFNFKNPFNK